MPHLSVHVLESDLGGRETELMEKLTDAVVAVYGEWARSIAVVQLIGLPPNRWGIGGTPARAPSPSVTFGIREAVFSRPDADEIVAHLVSEETDAIVDVFGERVRAGVTVELIGSPRRGAPASAELLPQRSGLLDATKHSAPQPESIGVLVTCRGRHGGIGSASCRFAGGSAC
jgi:phenylpyruvate tautomerase PptA (4-oxalocrotonate tautomerase family)